MKIHSKVIIFLIILAAGAVAFGVFSKKLFEQKQVVTNAAVAKIAVKVAMVKAEELNDVLSYVGDLKAKDEAPVFSKVNGKLVEYRVAEGETVTKGQTIAVIDRDETGLKFELAPVESPIAGVVGRILLDKGATVAPFINVFQQVSLATIVNMDEMVVKLNVPESAVPYVKNGLKAQIQVDAYPNENFIGAVSRVSEVVDIQTRALPIEITIPNKEHKLKSGMYAKVNLILQTRANVPVVLKEAIIGRDPNCYVYVIENNKAVMKRVTPGIRQGPYFEIKAGLAEGDAVVIMGQQRLFDGAEVRVEE